MTTEEITKFEEECREKINAMWFELLKQEYPIGTTFEMEGNNYVIKGYEMHTGIYYAVVDEVTVNEMVMPVYKLPKLKGDLQ